MLTVLSSPAMSNDVAIRNVTASHSANNNWRFDVTLEHQDDGWGHYADQWRILTVEGKELGVRTLLHPHDNEQPFTRSLSGVTIDPAIDTVMIEARDSVHGVSETVTISLDR
jgi:hypothetical protein